MKRRNFLLTGGIASAGILNPASTFAFSPENKQLLKDQQKINFTRDGLDLTSREYAALLTSLTENKGIEVDNYSRNGVVAELENRMAEILGKEKAIFMPTGTLANHIAVRKLAGNKKRILVQAESHLFNDSGDCATTLSGLHLVPLAPGRTSFELKDVENAIAWNNKGRVKTDIGVILIESPVRRQNNQMFDFESMKEVSEFARKNNIKLHLDGARLFNACVHSSKEPRDFAQLFDTVYVSLYKDFNAASGAILAGNTSFIDGLYHTRRMFGGGMPQVWPFAAVALNYLDGFRDAYSQALTEADQLFDILTQNGNFEIEKIPQGTNVVRFKAVTTDHNQFTENLSMENIDFPKIPNKSGEFMIKINPSILRSTPEEIAGKFIKAIE